MRNYTKPMTKGNFFRYYNKLNGADMYMIFFIYKKVLYKAVVPHIAQKWCYEGRESFNRNKMGEITSGGEQKWKMSLKETHKKELIRKGAVVVMTEEEFNSLPCKYSNKGDKCEWFLHQEYNLGEYTPNNFRFDKGGDVEIDGIQYQVKFENASLTNVKTLRRAQDSARQ